MSHKYQLPFFQKIAITINGLIRIILPLWIFINPWQGAVIALITDCIDYRPLVRWLHIPHKVYQLQDKMFDYYWYVLILVYSILYVKNLTVLLLIVFTFSLRSIGQLLFSMTKNEHVLLFFPNIQEPIFWIWLALPTLLNMPQLPITLLIIIILKLINEYYTHVLKGNPLDQILKLMNIKTNL